MELSKRLPKPPNEYKREHQNAGCDCKHLRNRDQQQTLVRSDLHALTPFLSERSAYLLTIARIGVRVSRHN